MLFFWSNGARSERNAELARTEVTEGGPKGSPEFEAAIAFCSASFFYNYGARSERNAELARIKANKGGPKGSLEFEIIYLFAMLFFIHKI